MNLLVFKNKIIFKIITALLAIVAFFWLTLIAIFSFFIDSNTLLRQNMPFDVSYQDKRVEYFFYPKIVLSNVTVANVWSDKVFITFAPLSFFTLRPKIAQISFADSTIDLSRVALESGVSHYQLVRDLIDNKIDISIVFNNLWLELFDQPFNFTNLNIANWQNAFELTGRVNQDWSLAILLDKSSGNLQLSLQDASNVIKIIEDYSGKESAKGSLSYINRKSAGAQESSSQLERGFSGDITLANDSFIFSNVPSPGSIIDGQLNFVISAEKFLLSADLQKLHLVSSDLVSTVANFIANNQQDKISFKGQTAIDVKIADLKIADQSSVDFKLVASNMVGENIVIDDLSGRFIDDEQLEAGSFNVSGQIQNSKDRSIASGNIVLSHQDLNKLLTNFGFTSAGHDNVLPLFLSSNFALTAVDLTLSDVNCKLGASQIDGQLSFRNIAQLPRVNGRLRFSDFDPYRHLPSLGDKLDYFSSLLLDSYKKDYLNQLVLIRNNPWLLNIAITSTGTTIKEQVYDQVDLLLSTSPGNININSFTVMGKDLELQGQLNINATNFQPMAQVVIYDGRLRNQDFAQTLLAFKEGVQKQINFNQLALSVNVALKELELEGQLLQNFLFSAASNNSMLLVNNLAFDLFGGSLRASGSIISNPFIVNLNASCANLDLANSLKNLPLLPGSSGLIGGSGSVSFAGDSLDEFVYSLKLDWRLLASQLLINKIGIDDLATRLAQVGYKAQLLGAGDLQSYATGGASKINELQGRVCLEQGVALLQDFKFSGAKYAGTMAGKVDLYNQSVDLQAQLALKINDKIAASQFDFFCQGSLFAPKNTLQLKEPVDVKKTTGPIVNTQSN